MVTIHCKLIINIDKAIYNALDKVIDKVIDKARDKANEFRNINLVHHRDFHRDNDTGAIVAVYGFQFGAVWNC